MELKSSAISETWKFRAFWCLVGCFITLVFLNQNQQKLDFSLLLGQFHPRFVTNTILSHPTVVSEPPADQPAFSLGDQLLNNTSATSTISGANRTKVEKSVNTNNTSRVVKQPISSNPADQSPADSATNQTKVVQGKINASPPPPPPPPPPPSPPPLPVEQPVIKSTTSTEQKGSLSSCNIFEGKWVYNADNQPYYNSTRCPFVEEKFSCQKNGRPDSDYEKWRWVANDCDIPLFDGKDMLERLRNKRLIIVGDSLNRNQWESLACLLYSSIPDPSRAEVSAGGPTYKFITAKDYNCTVEFFWSPFLVNSNDTHKSGRKVLTLDELTPLYPRFKGADVMVFNSGHWWTHAGKLRSWDVFEYEGKLVEEMPIELAFERAMKTWAKWVEKNVDPKKTKVLFRSISAAHHGRTWCYNNTQPILDDSYESHFPQKLRDAIERVIEGPSMSKMGVKYLNITKLSEYRRDAHPSMYRNTQWKQGTFQTQFADCSHWCLPGLPDTWNRLLYASLFFDTPST